MTKVYFEHGKYVRQEGDGRVSYNGITLRLDHNDFMLFGDLRSNIHVHRGSLDAKDATITNSSVRLFSSKAENINDAFKIRLWKNSSISNSSTNELETTGGNNTIEGIVSAKVVKFDENTTLSIAKDGVLKVPDKNALNFSKISGNGKIYGQKQHTYYDTNNKVLEYDTNIDLSTLNNGDGNEAFSFDGTKLVLNKGYEFNLTGDKPAFIVNNGVILKADINGPKLVSISGSGSIKELHLSANARFSINSDFGNAVIEKGSVLTLFKPVDFKNISGDGFVNINGTIYDTDGHALNNANSSLVASIKEHSFAVTKAIEKAKDKKDAYVNVDDQQNTDVALLNIEMINNDNLL